MVEPEVGGVVCQRAVPAFSCERRQGAIQRWDVGGALKGVSADCWGAAWGVAFHHHGRGRLCRPDIVLCGARAPPAVQRRVSGLAFSAGAAVGARCLRVRGHTLTFFLGFTYHVFSHRRPVCSSWHRASWQSLLRAWETRPLPRGHQWATAPGTLLVPCAGVGGVCAIRVLEPPAFFF